jgi:hypothetical protein
MWSGAKKRRGRKKKGARNGFGLHGIVSWNGEIALWHV